MQTVEITCGQDTGAHRVLTQAEADGEGLAYLVNWRDGQAGSWILTDDGFVVQVLHAGNFGSNRWMRTAQGTYRNRASDTLTTEPRQSRFKITGRKEIHGGSSNAHLSMSEKLFVIDWCSNGDLEAAYRKAFGADEITAASLSGGIRRLLARKRVVDYMQAHLGDVLKRQEIDPEFVIKNIKEIAVLKFNPKNGHNILPSKLKANAMLGVLVGVDTSPGKGRPPGGVLPPGEQPGEIEDAEFESIEADISQPETEAVPAGEMKELPAGDNLEKEN